MKILRYLIIFGFIFLSACLLEPTYKNFYDVKDGFTKDQVIQLWGDADIESVYETEWGNQTLLVYRCIKSVSCEESDCSFGAPCYFQLFDENGELISRYDSSF